MRVRTKGSTTNWKYVTFATLVLVATLFVISRRLLSNSVTGWDGIPISPTYEEGSATARLLEEMGLQVTEGNESVWSSPQAAMTGERVAELIRAGADVNARSRYGWTPLWVAEESRNPEAVRVLLEHNADPTYRYRGHTLLYAAVVSSTPITKLLLDFDADPNARTSTGETPLMRAARHLCSVNAAILIKGGADVKARDNQGRTATDYVPVYSIGESEKLAEQRADTLFVLKHGRLPASVQE